jgi:hypothetical protein
MLVGLKALVWSIPNFNATIHDSNPSVIYSSTNIDEDDVQEHIQDGSKNTTNHMHHQTLSGEDDKYMFYTLLCMFCHAMFCSVFLMFIDNLHSNKGILMLCILIYLEQLIMFVVACVNKLVIVVQTFIGNKGGTKDFALSFILGGDYLTLKFDANIKLLDIEGAFCLQKPWTLLGFGICTPTLLGHCYKLDKT